MKNYPWASLLLLAFYLMFQETAEQQQANADETPQAKNVTVTTTSVSGSDGNATPTIRPCGPPPPLRPWPRDANACPARRRPD